VRVDRSWRLGSLAGVPALWLALAWGDPWFLVVAVLSAAGAAWALRALARRRGDDDAPLVL
jgi:hypothetical protein